eukprot:scaffold1410_cov90-Skeletonema_marinoi.AAC.4
MATTAEGRGLQDWTGELIGRAPAGGVMNRWHDLRILLPSSKRTRPSKLFPLNCINEGELPSRPRGRVWVGRCLSDKVHHVRGSRARYLQ